MKREHKNLSRSAAKAMAAEEDQSTVVALTPYASGLEACPRTTSDHTTAARDYGAVAECTGKPLLPFIESVAPSWPRGLTTLVHYWSSSTAGVPDG